MYVIIYAHTCFKVESTCKESSNLRSWWFLVDSFSLVLRLTADMDSFLTKLVRSLTTLMHYHEGAPVRLIDSASEDNLWRAPQIYSSSSSSSSSSCWCTSVLPVHCPSYSGDFPTGVIYCSRIANKCTCSMGISSKSTYLLTYLQI